MLIERDVLRNGLSMGIGDMTEAQHSLVEPLNDLIRLLSSSDMTRFWWLYVYQGGLAQTCSVHPHLCLLACLLRSWIGRIPSK